MDLLTCWKCGARLLSPRCQMCGEWQSPEALQGSTSALDKRDTPPGSQSGAGGVEGTAISEPDTPQTAPHAAERSERLLVATFLLAILPLVLPFPFYSLAQQWIFPVAGVALQQCTDFTCQAATDVERQAWLLVLGPSILVAMASILVGTMGLTLARWHPTSPKNRALFRIIVTCGVTWAVLFGCTFWALFYLASIHD